MKPVVAATFVLVLAVLAVSGMGSRDNLARRYPGGLHLGYAAEAPYAFVDAAGRVTGVVPELGRHVAQRLGLPVTFVQSDFGALLEQLAEGRYDVVASGLFITPERARRVRFSVPTFQATDAALVRRGNPKHLHSFDDVRATGAIVVVLAGSVEEALARQVGIAPDRTIVVPDAAGARRALDSGRADLLLNSEPNVHWTARHESAGAFDVAEPFKVDAAGLGAPRLGTPEHLALIEPFGFNRRSLPPSADQPPSPTP